MVAAVSPFSVHMDKEPEKRGGLNSANPTEGSKYCQVRPQAFDPEVIYLPRDLWGTRGDGGEEDLGMFLGTGVSIPTW